MIRRRSWTVDQLTIAVRDSTSFRQVLMKIGLVPAGSNYVQVQKYIRENQLSIEHFKGHGWSRGLRGIGRPVRSLEEIFKSRSPFQSHKLRQRLIRAGLKPAHCEECGWARRTEDGYLPLELDHINGDRLDNRLENLRVLCPNCHSLKPTYRGRKNKKARVV